MSKYELKSYQSCRTDDSCQTWAHGVRLTRHRLDIPLNVPSLPVCLFQVGIYGLAASDKVPHTCAKASESVLQAAAM